MSWDLGAGAIVYTITLGLELMVELKDLRLRSRVGALHTIVFVVRFVEMENHRIDVFGEAGRACEVARDRRNRFAHESSAGLWARAVTENRV